MQSSEEEKLREKDEEIAQLRAEGLINLIFFWIICFAYHKWGALFYTIVYKRACAPFYSLPHESLFHYLCRWKAFEARNAN